MSNFLTCFWTLLNRDEAQTRMQALKERAEKDALSHAAELKELDRVLEQDRKLRDFMSVKGGDREQLDITQKRRQRSKQFHSTH